MPKICVIGAGPAGMSAAYVLAKRDAHVDVFEASDAVGGLAKTISLWGQKVDLGPHRFFSSDARVNRLWLDVMGNDYRMVDRLTRIYYKKKFFKYPLEAGNALQNLGLFEAARCILSYGEERLRPTRNPNASFEAWVRSRFGQRLYEIFFKAYTEKLWGIPCDALDADFAAQRIKKLSLWEAAKNAILGDGGRKHRTLVDRFAYPKEGTGAVYERMGKLVESKGGRVALKTPVQRVLAEPDSKRPEIEFADGRRETYDHVVSSMPLTLMVMRLPNVPAEVVEAAKGLKYRNTILVYLLVDKPDLFPDNWLYVHAPDLQLGRITNFRNWVPELYGDSKQTILALEFWCYDTDPMWQESDEQLISRAKREIQSMDLLAGAPVVDGHVHKISRCYPVYDRGYKDRVQVLVDYLRKIPTLTAVGRYGAFKYNNQDHSILMGDLAAQNILDNAEHDLWSINTDYESYQEQAYISETGLTQ